MSYLKIKNDFNASLRGLFARNNLKQCFTYRLLCCAHNDETLSLKPAIATILIIIVHNFSYSQAIVDTGKVEFVQEYTIKELLNKHIEINSKAAIKGYRIKIHFGADKNQAYEIKKKFSEKFPDVPAYAKYDQPNFNIRVGDYRTKLEAYKFLKEVQVEFPSAFLVQDDIEFPKLESSIKK